MFPSPPPFPDDGPGKFTHLTTLRGGRVVRGKCEDDGDDDKAASSGGGGDDGNMITGDSGNGTGAHFAGDFTNVKRILNLCLTCCVIK